jgi:photosystem II stability/assembly factor-like uncharacterized protein
MIRNMIGFALFWLLLLAAPVSQSDSSQEKIISSSPSNSIYLPVIEKSLESSDWQCYPFGGQHCPYNLTSVAMVSANEGWAVGGSGSILHYTNGTWRSIPGPTIGVLKSISMISAEEGWAVGFSSNQGAIILHYLDGIWQTVSSPTTIPLHAVFMISADEGWAVGGYSYTPSYHCTKFQAVILHYTNGAWQVSDTPPKFILYSVAMLSAEEGWAVGGRAYNDCSFGNLEGGAIFHYIDGSWQFDDSLTEFFNKRLFSVAVTPGQEGWAVGDAGVILHHSGGAWQVVNIPVDAQLAAVAMISDDDGWAVGQGGVILHYTGSAWQVVDSPAKVRFSALAMVSADEGWAFSADDAVLHYLNGVWQTDSYNLFGYMDIYSIDMVSDSDSWAVGRAYDHTLDQYIGFILHDTNGAWLVEHSLGSPLSSVDMVSANEGWAVGDRGVIIHITNGAYQFVSSPITETLRSVAMVSSDEGWAVGDQGVILHNTNGVWQIVESSTQFWLRGLSMVSADEGWAVGSSRDPVSFNEKRVVMHYLNGDWETVNIPSDWRQLFAVDMVSASEGWAVGNFGVVLHYTQGMWNLTESPTTRDLNAVAMISEDEGWIVGYGMILEPIR